MKNRTFSRSVFFIVFTAVLLYITYFILRDFSTVAGGIAHVIGSIISAFSPLWIGLILAYIINPMVETIDSKVIRRISQALKKNPPEDYINNEAIQQFIKNRTEKPVSKTKSRILSIVITYLLIIAAIIAIIYGFAAMILGQVIITNIPDLFESAMNLAISYEAEFKAWASNLPSGVFSSYVSEGINTIFAWISDNFNASGIISTVSGLSSSVVNFVLGIIVSIYLIADKDFFLGIWDKLVYLICPKQNTLVKETLGEINVVLSSFIRGVLIDSVCVATLSSIVLSVIHLKFAVFIGIFAGIANVIPYFGPVLGMIPAFLIGVFTDSFLKGVIAVITLIVVQQIDANIIYPRVVGSSTGLKPLFVLLAVSAAGYYGGIMGMLIAVPTAGIIQVFVLKLADMREAQIIRKEKEALAAQAALEAAKQAEAEATAAMQANVSRAKAKTLRKNRQKVAVDASATSQKEQPAEYDFIDSDALEEIVCKAISKVINKKDEQ